MDHILNTSICRVLSVYVKMTGSTASRNPVGRNEIHTVFILKKTFSKINLAKFTVIFVSINTFKIASLHSYWLTVLAMAMEQISPFVQRCRHFASRYSIKWPYFKGDELPCSWAIISFFRHLQQEHVMKWLPTVARRVLKRLCSSIYSFCRWGNRDPRDWY